MKCIVLAGGAGNRLWPLSRKNYPKQFVDLKGGHSLFQETIVRNMPFCDEFWIFTSSAYRSIVEGQLQPFQNLAFRCFCEEEGKKTAPAIALAALLAEKSEEMLIVSTDNMVEGDYKTAVVAARQSAAEGRIVCMGVSPDSANPGYGFFRAGAKGVDYRFPAGETEAAALMDEGGWLWDTGILLACAETFVREMRLCCPEVLSAVEPLAEALELPALLSGEQRFFRIPAGAVRGVPAVGLGPALTAKSPAAMLQKAFFGWTRIVNLTALLEYYRYQDLGESIKENCRDVSVMNLVPGRLVVANDLRDSVVIATADATYVSGAKDADRIKEIVREHYDEFASYFDEGSLYYAAWGVKESLCSGGGYRVKRLTVYPGKALSSHTHMGHSEHWNIVSGTATVTLDGNVREYYKDESCFVPAGAVHLLENRGYENLVLIETSVGERLAANAQGGDADLLPAPAAAVQKPELLRLEPAFKDYLWGGTLLRDRYGKRCDFDVIAESWELSAHEAGPSTVASGRSKGVSFPEYLQRLGRAGLGWKCQSLERFPLLIKMIDAASPLSVQVHPGDDYALANEGEYGKNEMWYIVDAAPDAYLYCGFTQKVTRDEVRRRVQEGSITEILNRVPVQKGETYFIPAGTVHAIGKGVLICEVQQSSNVTYRLYDYGRREKKTGAMRPLHLEKALDVLSLEPSAPTVPVQSPEGGGMLLCQCKYFRVVRHELDELPLALRGEDSSFRAFVFLSGEGSISCDDAAPLRYRPADTFFASAGKSKIEIIGTGTVLEVSV